MRVCDSLSAAFACQVSPDAIPLAEILRYGLPAKWAVSNRASGASFMDFINPSSITAPASNYSQGVRVPIGSAAMPTRRLIISGQIGMTKDGKVVEGMEAQLRLTWS